MKKVFCGRLVVSFLTLTVGAGCVLAQDGPRVIEHRTNQSHATAPPTGGTGQMAPPITWNGGPIMSGIPKAYLIWYGDWNQSNGSDNPAGQQLVRDFIFGVSNSPYEQINSTYTGPSGTVVSGSVALGGETTDANSSGRLLTNNDIKTIVTRAITTAAFPLDANGVYFVLTSSNIIKPGFCTQYCGWHTFATIQGVNVKYSFVGNANRCLSTCAQQTISPNGNAGVDGMISVLAHELEETTSDPQLNAWFDSANAENADKCAWTFGAGQTMLPSGAFYNMTLPKQFGLGTNNYLVQRNLSAVDSKCYVALNGQQ